METLTFTHSPSLSSPSRPLPSFRSIHNRSPLLRRRHLKLKLVAVYCSISTSPNSIPSNYAGWDDDMDLTDESIRYHNLDPLHSFLISLGIDRNRALMFLLGFLSALVVFRAKSSIVLILPMSILIFIAGFSTGASQAGVLIGFMNQIGRKGREFVSFDGKTREIGDFLDELGDKMSDLKNGLESAIDSNRLDVGSIKSYLDVVEVLRSVAVDTKKSMEDSVDQVAGRRSSPKASRKRREGDVVGFDFVQSLGGLFEDYMAGLRPVKAKDANKEQPMEQGGNNLDNSRVGRVKGDASEKVVPDKPVDRHRIPVERDPPLINGEKSHYGRDGKGGDDMLAYDDELDSRSRTLHFMTKKSSFERLVFKQIYKGRTSQNDVYESEDHSRRREESMNFFSSESETHDESYFVSRGRKSMASMTEQAMVKPEDRLWDSEQSRHGRGEDYVSSSSKALADEEFNRNVEEATNLVKLARECMVREADEEGADSMLYKSARLLSTAVSLKPMSLLAMGQLGNTYLLHGELKLKISRELRTLLLRSDGVVNGKGRGVRLNKLDTRALRREDVAAVLVDVCEECDMLLVEAGRKYRKALAIDGDDIRALYNWGLALSFRAQLIADIGPEAAFDADKVYLAAIDKFNAMMSRSNAHAPDALYRWGVALQRRSELRSDNSKEKIKLLQQAKSLFEDVLCMESDNKLVREALASCLSELDYSRQW